jgi:putative endopeptidase
MECIGALYSGFQIADTQVVGSKTLGENMADFGGVKIAHAAMLSWQESTLGSATSEADERLFFTSFAQLWCEKGRKLSLQSRVARDVHSPGPFRSSTLLTLYAWALQVRNTLKFFCYIP